MEVAPSRVRELKQAQPPTGKEQLRRTLTGAWIETVTHGNGRFVAVSHPHGCVNWNKNRRVFIDKIKCRTLTGAWIETIEHTESVLFIFRRTLTGAWIETYSPLGIFIPYAVAPSRVRELKL